RPASKKKWWDLLQKSHGKFLSNIKNALNGLHFGYGVPVGQIKIAAALHGPSNMLNYDNYIWEKYKVGEWLDIIDPITKRPAVRNIFYKSKGSVQNESTSNDPDNEHS